MSAKKVIKTSLFKKYDKCIYCNSKNLKKEKNQVQLNNFYLNAIKSDLGLSSKHLRKMKVYKCQKCFILQSNPWFSESIASKIYSNIYGQHNRSWSNIINFSRKGITPSHGILFSKLKKYIKIKNYAEFNSPFMGLMMDFFSTEYKKNNLFLKNIFTNTLNYLSCRQVAGKSIYKKKLSNQKASLFLKTCKNLKKKYSVKTIKKVNKYLFIDNSPLSWGQNDNFKSVNSKSFASEFFDLQIMDLNKKIEKVKIDLFGIFHTLDHTMQPNKVLNFALNNSDYVLVYCHVDKFLEKQHLFSLSVDFMKSLNKKKIYTYDITKSINKIIKAPELYFLCSKKKKYIDKIRKNEKKNS
tara:strand:- start:1910 stop:2968 length:1059 start_codon:yes stop_codon:yes gene_type:complete